jgi:hypothetical protein
MKTNQNPIHRLPWMALALFALVCHSAQAQSIVLNQPGTSVLADYAGTTAGPEALTVSWTVTENASDLYTYTYVVNNPAGDVLLPGSYSPGTPEIVDSFLLNFNAALQGTLVGAPTAGNGTLNYGSYGLFWSFQPVQAGHSTTLLSFESEMAPIWGDASASDDNPPSPWSSSPYGQPVPVPDPLVALPEPSSLALLFLAVLLFLPMAFRKPGKAIPILAGRD